MSWDPVEFARANLIDPESLSCLVCHRDYNGPHDLRCGAAIYFGLPRRAYPDHAYPIGPITAADYQRREERLEAMTRANRLLKEFYA